MSFYQENFKYDFLSEEQIHKYVEYVFENNELEYEQQVIVELKSRLEYFFNLFNLNLKHCGFSIFLYRNSMVNSEPELHTSYSIN